MKSTEAERKYQREYYQKNRRAISGRNRKTAAAWARRQRKNKREAALAALGGKCVHCGFLDARALQIDHVHGGGIKELKKFGMTQSGYYGKNGYLENVVALAHTGKYQLLCANCNWIKRVEEKETSRNVGAPRTIF